MQQHATWESEGEKSWGSPSAYHCACRLMFTRGRNRLNICNNQPTDQDIGSASLCDGSCSAALA